MQLYILQSVVIEVELAVQWQTDELTECHLREDQTVLGLHFLYFRLTAFGFHFQQILLRGKSFSCQFLYVALQRDKQVIVLIGELLLVLHVHYAPIGFVD